MPQDSFYGMPVPGPRIDELPDVDAINPSNGDTLVYNSTTKKWEHGTGGWVSSIYSKWDVDAPPVSAGALDDEFQDSSLNVAWTEYDPGARMTSTEDTWGLRFDYTAAGATSNISGLYKSIPAGDFTIITRISMDSIINQQNTFGGLALWEDGADAHKKMYLFGINHANTTVALSVEYWTAHDTWSSTPATTVAYKDVSFLYLRIRRIAGSTSYFFDLSTDGMTWYQLYTTAAPAFTPTHFGIFLNLGAISSRRAFYKFFRYLASDVGLLAPINGRRLTIGQGALAIIAAPLNPGQAMFSYEGAISITTGKMRIYNATGVSKTITRVTISANTAPTGAAILVDIHKNGVTIFTAQANRPTIVAGANMGYTNVIDIPAFADGDYLTADIDQVGSTIPGSDVSIIVGYV